VFQVLAGLLAFFYAAIPNYGVAIALLTLAVMLALSPLTLKSTRSMLAMQKLQPKMKQLQQKHKGDRQKLNEEMMALYKEHKVNPVSGCLPMLLQLPVFFVMYQIVRGLTRTAEGGCPGFDPKYVDEGTRLFQDLCRSGGEMNAFGVDLAKGALQDHGSVFTAIPYFLLVALVVFVQYYQTRQMTRRNPQSVQSAQLQMMTKIFPAFFGIISLSIQAALNVYFLVSGAFRVAQQGAMYRWDPTLVEHVQSKIKEAESKAVDAKSREKGGAGAKGKAKGRSMEEDGSSEKRKQPDKAKRQSDKGRQAAKSKRADKAGPRESARSKSKSGGVKRAKAQAKGSGRTNGSRPPKRRAKSRRSR
jgi:YidC/Oxa1 family membrane protein insertase